jgi:hypothetical protein
MNLFWVFLAAKKNAKKTPQHNKENPVFEPFFCFNLQLKKEKLKRFQVHYFHIKV